MSDERSRPRLIKTPVHNIPIGEAVKNRDGHYSLRIKKPKGNEIEDVPLDKLLSMVVSTAEEDNKAEAPHVRDSLNG